MSTATNDGTVDLDGLGSLHYLGIGLAVLSGVIHLFLGVSFAPEPLGLSFLFAGLVFLLAVAALLVNYRRRLLYGLGIPFTAGQILLWYYLNFAAGDKAFPADVGGVGAVDKLAQVALIVVLVLLLREA
ncbi:MAG: hypothetical protein ACOCSD_03880 [Halolamina sp.]